MALVCFVAALSATAQSQEPNTMRYFLNDKTVFDIRLSELEQIKRIGKFGLRNVYSAEDKNSKGMTMDEFADLVASQEGVLQAYNLDGGASSSMLFRNQKVNCPNRSMRREIVDILYFASAWVPDSSDTPAAE